MNFQTLAKVNRIMDEHDPKKLKTLMVEIEVYCVRCMKKLKFRGVPGGLNFHSPTVNVPGTEVRLPADMSDIEEENPSNRFTPNSN